MWTRVYPTVKSPGGFWTFDSDLEESQSEWRAKQTFREGQIRYTALSRNSRFSTKTEINVVIRGISVKWRLSPLFFLIWRDARSKVGRGSSDSCGVPLKLEHYANAETPPVEDHQRNIGRNLSRRHTQKTKRLCFAGWIWSSLTPWEVLTVEFTVGFNGGAVEWSGELLDSGQCFASQELHFPEAEYQDQYPAHFFSISPLFTHCSHPKFGQPWTEQCWQ